MFGSEFGKPFRKLARRFRFPDFRLICRDYIARIETFFCFHYRYARFFLAIYDSILNGRGASVFRKKRSMNIYNAFRANFENFFRKNLPVSARHHYVRVKLFKFFRAAVAYFLELKHGNTVFFGNDFYGRRRDDCLSADRSVGLTDNRDYFVKIRIYYFFKRFNRKFGGPEINNFHFTPRLLNYSLCRYTKFRRDGRFHGR